MPLPFSITAKTFKQQSKLLSKNWPFSQVKVAHVRNVLSQVYGYKNSHHYQQLSKTSNNRISPITQEIVVQSYTLWIQRLAKLAPMNEIQAKRLIHLIWSQYLKDIDGHDKLYQCHIQFVGDCNIFLDESLQNKPVLYKFDDKPSVKDAIESIGVPHPEVLAIHVIDPQTLTTKFVDFNHKLTDACQVKVYSSFDNLPETIPVEMQLPYKPKKLTFLLDVHLGGLARYLRMAGFDCLFDTQDYGDAMLAEIAHQQDLILLTRDINLLKRGKVTYGRWIRNVLPEAQFHEVVSHYKLQNDFRPFSICIKCNGHIHSVDKSKVVDKVPESVFYQLDEFKQCDNCQQIYWQGSHYDKIQSILTRAKAL